MIHRKDRKILQVVEIISRTADYFRREVANDGWSPGESRSVFRHVINVTVTKDK